MGRRNWVDGSMWEFPQPAFWLVHVLGTVMIFFLGMRFAVRRAPVPIVMYRLFRALFRR